MKGKEPAKLYYSYEQAKKVVQELGIKTYREWCLYASPYYLEPGPNNTLVRKGLKPQSERRDPRLPSDPPSFYRRRNEWKGWGDFLGTGNVANSRKKYHSYEEAKKIVHAMKIRTIEDYQKLVKTLGPSFGLPPYPNVYYLRKNGKFSWRDFLHPKFPDYEEAKRILAAKEEIKSVGDYRKAKKEDPDLENFPSSPEKAYEDQWEGWPVFLDSKRKREMAKNRKLLEQHRESLKKPKKLLEEAKQIKTS